MLCTCPEVDHAFAARDHGRASQVQLDEGVSRLVVTSDAVKLQTKF